MAVFFENKISLNKGSISGVGWHSKDVLLAVAEFDNNSGGLIHFYNDQGEKNAESGASKPCNPKSMQWHPTKQILAIGWENGEISCWNEQEHVLFDAPHVHQSDVRCVAWSSLGTRLLSADSAGILNLWKVDAKGRVQQTPLAKLEASNGVSSLLLKPIIATEGGIDIAALAKAAVSGDEKALDMLSWNNNSGLKLGNYGKTEATCFFVGCINGSVYFINDKGVMESCFETEGAVKRLLFYEPKSSLITVTDSGHLTQHNILTDGTAREVTRFKLACRATNPEVIFAGETALAMAMGECIVRIWDLVTEDNYTLEMERGMGYEENAQLNSIAFSSKQGILAAGSATGQMAFWKYCPAPANSSTQMEPEQQWQLQKPAILEGSISQVSWGTDQQLLCCAASTADKPAVYQLRQQILSTHYNDTVALVQVGPCSLQVGLFNTSIHAEVVTDIQIHGLCTNKELMAVWNGRRVVVCEYSADKNSLISQLGDFASSTPFVCLHEQNVYTVEPLKIEVRTPQGTVKQLLTLTDSEGDVINMDINGNFLVIATTKGCVRLYDLSRREAKPIGNPKFLIEYIRDFTKIDTVRCNNAGTLVSVICAHQDGRMDPKLYVWDVENDRVEYFNFETGRGEQDDYIIEDTAMTEEDKSKLDAAQEIAGRYPVHHFWDSLEPKLVVVEARLLEKSTEEKEEAKRAARHNLGRQPSASNVRGDETETMIISIFATPENGILMQDSFAMHTHYNHLMGVDAPYYYFSVRNDIASRPILEASTNLDMSLSASTGRIPENKYVGRRVMRDFVGLEEADKASKEAMMAFSFYLTIGNMDEAFKAMKLIKSESVWHNMAKMCVKTRRLDVAGVCLGKMGDAKAAMMLREARAAEAGDTEAQVAVLAMQLGQAEEAERLLKQCHRSDLLNQLYQAKGAWQLALDVAAHKDRIHLRATHYNYAKYLETKGEIAEAIDHYTKSDTHRFEVPRMLFDSEEELEAYIRNNQDKALRRWWGRYQESLGNMEIALKFYEASQDYLNMVRVHCFLDQLEKAAEICNDFGDQAACYHLARHYENMDNVSQAVHFYTRAQAISSALRLCKENGRDDHLYNLAMLGRRADMADAARYLEHVPGYTDKAVTLYHRSGQVSRAVDLAFRTKQFDALQAISSDLDEKTDPALLQKCADFFMENNQFDRAVDLMASGKQYWEAVKLCVDHNVPVDEGLAEKLTPPKGDVDDTERIRLLESIGDVCYNQRQYHVACKKFTLAGNRMKAMKSLLKSGDKEKIIFFAGVSKQREIYIMAANFLQSLDWRKEPDIMKHIIQFYTKGRSLDSLAAFYEACADVEVDEYKNYEKALGALGEAFKCLSKAKMENTSLQESRLSQLKNRMLLVKKFVDAQQTYATSPDAALQQCQTLLEETNLGAAVRVGHVYAFMVEHFVKSKKYKAAYSCLEELKTRLGPRPNLTLYVPVNVLESIHRALDMPFTRPTPSMKNGGKANGKHDEEDEEEEEEEVAEDIRTWLVE